MPMLLIETPEPDIHRVLEKSTSVRLVCARPATLPNMDSTPRREALFARPQPADRVHGLISNWVAPAEPARSGLPAHTVPLARLARATRSIARRFIMRFMSMLP